MSTIETMNCTWHHNDGLDASNTRQVSVYFETDGNFVPRWEPGILRRGRRGYVLDTRDGSRVFPLQARTVQVHADNCWGEPIFRMDELGNYLIIKNQ